jgi:hypothetical protein
MAQIVTVANGINFLPGTPSDSIFSPEFSGLGALYLLKRKKSTPN